MRIFLSYSRKDEDAVKVLAQGFEDARMGVWFDQDLGGGDAWWDTILENIRSASVFVFALSDASLHSKPCRAELDYARKLGRPVLPVKVGPVANLRSSPVADLQTITFRSDTALSAFKILAAVERKAHELRPLPKPLPTPPPIPYAYLLALGRQIDSTELDHEQQTTVVDQLHRAIREETDEGVQQDIVAMLRNLMNKPWTTRRTAEAAKSILSNATTTPDGHLVGGQPQTNSSAEESAGGPILLPTLRAFRWRRPQRLVPMGAALVGLIALIAFVWSTLGQPDLPTAAAPLGPEYLLWRRPTDGNWGIGLLDVNRGIPGIVLVEGNENQAPVISRDRRTMLYLRVDPVDPKGPTTLRAVATDGSNDKLLFRDGTHACPHLRRPALSSHGTLALVCGGSTPDDDRLNLMRLDGSLIKELDRGRLGDPTWSRDESSLVYTRASAGEGATGGMLYAVDTASGGQPRQLTDMSEGLDTNPVFSPTRDEIAFGRTEGGRQWIVKMSMKPGGSSVNLTKPGKLVDRDPSWSPDGLRLAFRRGIKDSTEIFVINEDGGSARRVLNNPGFDKTPAWSSR